LSVGYIPSFSTKMLFLRHTDALKTHRRDQFIEWIKGLLAVPFVLLSQPTAVHGDDKSSVDAMALNAHKRYAEIMKDVEGLIFDHIQQQKSDPRIASKLKLLVPSVGTFFTPLPLQDAFKFQDERRYISSRRFVAPSFNDVRLVLNTAQAMSLIRSSKLELVTFVSLNPECRGKTSGVTKLTMSEGWRCYTL